ncbi:hypothetical protein, partial [Streptomyces sp. NPDC059744]|uniref:hypothetical protein n=1 Tax=Streptomyces sp. NPDC059744 TaxID=3346929 RepID=UPI00364B0F64
MLPTESQVARGIGWRKAMPGDEQRERQLQQEDRLYDGRRAGGHGGALKERREDDAPDAEHPDGRAEQVPHQADPEPVGLRDDQVGPTLHDVSKGVARGRKHGADQGHGSARQPLLSGRRTADGECPRADRAAAGRQGSAFR